MRATFYAAFITATLCLFSVSPISSESCGWASEARAISSHNDSYTLDFELDHHVKDPERYFGRYALRHYVYSVESYQSMEMEWTVRIDRLPEFSNPKKQFAIGLARKGVFSAFGSEHFDQHVGYTQAGEIWTNGIAWKRFDSQPEFVLEEGDTLRVMLNFLNKSLVIEKNENLDRINLEFYFDHFFGNEMFPRVEPIALFLHIFDGAVTLLSSPPRCVSTAEEDSFSGARFEADDDDVQLAGDYVCSSWRSAPVEFSDDSLTMFSDFEIDVFESQQATSGSSSWTVRIDSPIVDQLIVGIGKPNWRETYLGWTQDGNLFVGKEGGKPLLVKSLETLSKFEQGDELTVVVDRDLCAIGFQKNRDWDTYTQIFYASPLFGPSKGDEVAFFVRSHQTNVTLTRLAPHCHF